MGVFNVDAVKAQSVAGRQEAMQEMAAKHPAACPVWSLASSEAGEGIEALRAELAGFALPTS